MVGITIQQEDVGCSKCITHKARASSYLKQMLMELKGELDSNIIVMGDFNIVLS